MNQTQPSDFNQKATFCTTKPMRNEITGVTQDEPVSLFTLWCAPYKRTLNQQYAIANTTLEDTIIIAVHHNEDVNDSLTVKYRNDDYNIVTISPDVSNQILTMDLITMRRVTGVGD